MAIIAATGKANVQRLSKEQSQTTKFAPRMGDSIWEDKEVRFDVPLRLVAYDPDDTYDLFVVGQLFPWQPHGDLFFLEVG